VGRNRSYQRDDVLAKCADVFLRTGYEGTSIDDLVMVTGLHRGSIYTAFGSKRGLFVAVLDRVAATGMTTPDAIDLVLVALLELAPHDEQIRESVTTILADSGGRGTSQALGGRLLERAGLTHAARPVD
jgi:TetR/AcrR family transcriptional repressor of nem operon